MFCTVIQLATALAVVDYYREKIIFLISSFFFKKETRTFCYKIIIALLPTVFCGYFFYHFIRLYLSGFIVTSVALILGGVAYLCVENKYHDSKEENKIEDITYKKSLYIGLIQSIALIPGASRSGMTILGGLLNKLSRVTSVEFSFLLSIPTILAASTFEIYKEYSALEAHDIQYLMSAFIITFLTASYFIQWFINYISNHDFRIFAYYRIFFGLVFFIYYLKSVV